MDVRGRSCLGIKEWYKPRGSTPIDADIVAVHGFAANPFWTWAARKDRPSSNFSGDKIRKESSRRVDDRGLEGDDIGEEPVLWLQKFLPEYVPGCRILTFGYESNYLVGAPKRDIANCAQELLLALKAFRSEEQDRTRPIVFIGHSFGGIIVKEALIKATLNSKLYGSIRWSTHGIVFLGTPHRGASVASYGEILVAIAKTMGLGSDRRLIHSLRRRSSELLKLAVNFSDIFHDFEIFCFYELLPWKFSSVIVDQQSATLEGRPSDGLTVTHSGMNKYVDINDPNLLKICKAITAMILSLKKSRSEKAPSVGHSRAEKVPWQTASDLAEEIENMFDKVIKLSHSKSFEDRYAESMAILKYRFQSWAFNVGLMAMMESRRALHEHLAQPTGAGICTNLTGLLEELVQIRNELNSENKQSDIARMAETVQELLQDLFAQFPRENQGMMWLDFANRVVRINEDVENLEMLARPSQALSPPDVEAVAAMKRIKLLADDSLKSYAGETQLMIPYKDMEIDKSKSLSRSTGYIESSASPKQRSDILIEWKKYSGIWDSEIGNELFRRTEVLAEFLRTASRSSNTLDLRLLECFGFTHDDSKARLGFVFGIPRSVSDRRSLIRLNQLMQAYQNYRKNPPAVGDRMEMAKLLCKAIFGFHIAEWFHKTLSSHMIVLFADDDIGDAVIPKSEQVSRYSILAPFILGFEYSRPSKPHEFSEPMSLSNEMNIYRHPDYKGVPMQKYRHEFDYYSLGLVLLEIGLWSPLSAHIKESEMLQEELVANKIAHLCSLLDSSIGAIYQAVVKALLSSFDQTAQKVAHNNQVQLGDLIVFQTEILESLGHCHA